MKLTKADLILAVERRLQIAGFPSARAVDAIFEALVDTLSRREAVRLHGFGKFQVHRLAGRRYRLPDKRSVDPGVRHTVRFTPFKGLKARVAGATLDDLEQQQLERLMPARDRRIAPRRDDPGIGTAIIRVSGIPVCEFKIKDISDGGSALLVEQDSVMLRNVRVGQQVDIWLNHNPSATGPALQRAVIVHITPAASADLQGYYQLGIRSLGKMPI